MHRAIEQGRDVFQERELLIGTFGRLFQRHGSRSGRIGPAPKASAAQACAPPTRQISVTPASCAAANTAGSSLPGGVTMAIRSTPATRAGTAFINTVDG